MIGESDLAYGRLKRCLAFDQAVKDLRGARKDAYPVRMLLKKGFGHGGLPDRDHLETMMPAVRNPIPDSLVWQPTDSVVGRFSWLEIPAPAKKQLVEATRTGNRFEIKLEGTESLNLYLDERMVDYRKPVVIEVNGRPSSTASSAHPWRSFAGPCWARRSKGLPLPRKSPSRQSLRIAHPESKSSGRSLFSGIIIPLLVSFPNEIITLPVVWAPFRVLFVPLSGPRILPSLPSRRPRPSPLSRKSSRSSTPKCGLPSKRTGRGLEGARAGRTQAFQGLP